MYPKARSYIFEISVTINIKLIPSATEMCLLFLLSLVAALCSNWHVFITCTLCFLLPDNVCIQKQCSTLFCVFLNLHK